MTGPNDTQRGDENAAPDAAGMPAMDPPAGGPNEDPDTPDPADLMPPRPGALPGDGVHTS